MIYFLPIADENSIITREFRMIFGTPTEVTNGKFKKWFHIFDFYVSVFVAEIVL